MKSTITFIYFDLAGVQYNFRTGLTQFVKKQGISYEDFAQKLALFEERANKGFISIAQLVQRYNDVLHVSLTENNYLDFWISMFTPILPMHTFIKTLPRKYKIGLLSNIHAGLLPKLIDKGIVVDRFYDQIIQSFQLHVAKPEKEIYEIAQRHAHVSAEQILLIDDNPYYVAAAKENGWNSIQFDETYAKEGIEYLSALL